MSAPWHLQRLAALDFECSDKVPETARAVSCALILVGGGLGTDMSEWLINPGIKQEPGAIAVHKLTDEYLAERGQDAGQAIGEIVKRVAEVVAAGIPLVGHNLGSFDLNLLNHECLRHLGDTLEGICRQPLTRVIDTLVLDKHCAPFRRRVSENQGAYQMKTTAQTYGLGWDDEKAHGAKYDALMSVRAAWHMGNIAHLPREQRPDWVQRLANSRGPYDHFDDLAGIDVNELHLRQVWWAAEQAASFQEHLRKTTPDAVIDGSWPLRPIGGEAS